MWILGRALRQQYFEPMQPTQRASIISKFLAHTSRTSEFQTLPERI